MSLSRRFNLHTINSKNLDPNKKIIYQLLGRQQLEIKYYINSHVVTLGFTVKGRKNNYNWVTYKRVITL